MSKDNKGISKRTDGNKLNAFDYGLDIVRNRDEAFEFFTELLKGRSNGVSTPREAMLVYGRCRELGLPFMSTLDHMVVIGDKVCADIHIKTALALRAGKSLYWEKLKDFEPQYKYTDGANVWISPLKPIPFLAELGKDDPIADRLQYTFDKASLEACEKANKTAFWNESGHNAPYDYVTEYKFYRIRKMADGNFKTIEAVSRFGRMQSYVAQLGFGKSGSEYEGTRDPNSNWGKYEPRMVDIRAFDDGLKQIASDLMMGLPEISEMAEVHNVEYYVDEDTNSVTVKHDKYASDIQDVEEIKEDTPAND